MSLTRRETLWNEHHPEDKVSVVTKLYATAIHAVLGDKDGLCRVLSWNILIGFIYLNDFPREVQDLQTIAEKCITTLVK